MSDLGSVPENRVLFGRLLNLREEEFPLARACLLIAAEEYPSLDIDHYMSRLAQMSYTAAERTRNRRSPCELVEGLNQFLFEELRFRGNVQEYFDPENSYLNRVLERKTGIPITLSVVYLEVGWHLGIPLAGVGFPGHFLVKYQCHDGEILIDPFGGGAILNEEECRDKLTDLYGESAELCPQFFRTTSKRQILTRVLNNLKNIYLNANDCRRALGIVEMLLMLNPRAYSELRDRGLLNYRLELYSDATRDLESYLQHCPRCRDAATVAENLSQIRRLIN